jgi:hypothetical protein
MLGYTTPGVKVDDNQFLIASNSVHPHRRARSLNTSKYTRHIGVAA